MNILRFWQIMAANTHFALDAAMTAISDARLQGENLQNKEDEKVTPESVLVDKSSFNRMFRDRSAGNMVELPVIPARAGQSIDNPELVNKVIHIAQLTQCFNLYNIYGRAVLRDIDAQNGSYRLTLIEDKYVFITGTSLTPFAYGTLPQPDPA